VFSPHTVCLRRGLFAWKPEGGELLRRRKSTLGSFRHHQRFRAKRSFRLDRSLPFLPVLFHFTRVIVQASQRETVCSSFVDSIAVSYFAVQGMLPRYSSLHSTLNGLD